MKLLTYTRYLRQKIKFYDKITASQNFYTHNPFEKRTDNTITIIWVEDYNDE